MKPSADIDIAGDVCVSVTVRNPAWGQSAKDVKIDADIFSHTRQSLGTTLDVFYPVYHAAIEQSSAFPCDTNTITIKVSATVPIYGYCTNIVTVTGLCGSTTPDSSSFSIAITSGVSQSNALGSWNGAAGTLQIDLQRVINTNEVRTFVNTNDYMVFKVNVTNQKCPQAQCNSGISVGGTSGLAADGDQNSWTVSSSNLEIESGDKHPMKIVQAQLTTTLVQGGTHVCVESELNIVFRSNVPLKRACLPNITLYGLNWFEDPDNFMLTPINLIPGVTPGAGNTNPFAFPLSARWIRASVSPFGSAALSLQIGDGIAADTTYKIKFYGASSSVSASKLVSKRYTGVINVGLNAPSVVQCIQFNTFANVSFEESSAQKAQLIITEASQSTCFPCDHNQITVKFRVNQAIVGDCLNTLTISGLGGYENHPGYSNQQDYPVVFDNDVVNDIDDLFENTGIWNKESGTFVLKVATVKSQKKLDDGVMYRIRMDFTNPASPRAASEVTIVQNPDAQELYEVISSVVYENSCLRALHIKPMTFHTTGCMSYTSAFAADLNTVSVNFYLGIKVLQSCSPQIRIGPLKGICVTDFTNISMSSGSNFSGTYDSLNSYAIFTLNGDLDEGEYPLTFDVINPLDVQENRAPIVFEMALAADTVSAPSTITIQPCQADLFSPKCPEFLERNVRQSSKYAGDWNNITMSLYSTVRLAPPAVITIAGFYRTSACSGGSESAGLSSMESKRAVRLMPGDFTFSSCNKSSDTCDPNGHTLFSSSASLVAPAAEGHYDTRLGRATMYLKEIMKPGVYYSFSFTIRNPVNQYYSQGIQHRK